jgi:acyl-CoA synthetase (AMP-forming)/AMP-acid ligase II
MTVAGTDFRDGFESLTEALARHAEFETPAFTFVDYGSQREGSAGTITWAELDRRARTVAALLTRTTTPGERVALLCPQNLDYVIGFLGALYAGTIAVPLFAPEAHSHAERLIGALADCAPEVWLTSTSALPAVTELRDRHPVPRPKQLFAVDTVDSAPADGFRPVPVTADEPAYLQYTSGSTRRPAGAVITHRAVMANVRQAEAAFGVEQSTVSVGWLPFFHDMGLIQLVCLPVALRCHSVFTTPAAFTRRPTRWLRMLAAYPNALTAAPNFAYEYVASKMANDTDLDGLDLSGVKVAINGSEPVRAVTITQFAEATSRFGFAASAHRPSYGLAEATVFVSTMPTGSTPRFAVLDREGLGAGRAVVADPADERAITLVSAGRSVGQHVRVVDPERGQVVPDGTVGEIWVHGPNVASGYWQQPDATEQTFGGRLTDTSDLPSTCWLRTGDLGVIHEGDLFVTGRMKDMIIIDGRNHYPHDIEATVQESHPAIRRDRLAVFGVERDGHEVPVVVAEHSQHVSAGDLDFDEVDRAARAAVSRHHDLRLFDFVLVRPGLVPRTSSGKIARSAARAAYLSGALTAVGSVR